MALQQPLYTHDKMRGLWIWGEPGAGKSTLARKHNGYYLKAQNKWWDGYTD